MNQKQHKTAYSILILLILLAIAVVGGLIMVLFNTHIPEEKIKTIPAPNPPQTNLVITTTPISERIIEVQPSEVPTKEEPKPKSTASITPAICEGYGAQIRSRDAYKDPVTYSASVQPNHVRFTLYADRKLNSK